MIDFKNRYVRRFSMIIAAIATVVYMSYRGMYTLNLSSIYAGVASVSLYLAEMYGCFLMFLYFFQIWELVEPEPVPPLENRTVDVFIPTYNEDPELLRGTISAAVALDYPHETYVLDDGKRPDVAELSRELGAKYIARESNLHAKAGNLNHAMEITDGEFIIIFDADHISRKDFITRLLGYFGDERMGFVQTPHSFYNFDNFHGCLDYEKGRYWEEGELFYNVTQPGKNYWNAVSFCGSAAMFRREALVDVGLVATETITEDMHTGLRMHANGWNSLFVNERLVAGQAATDVTTFNTQRLRWGEGNLGVFAYDNPITMKGLTFGQRIGYLGSMLSWTTGVQKLQLYIAPMLMLLTGVPPVAELSWTLFTITFVYMMTIWASVIITSNGHGHLIGTELTHMASFWTQIKSSWRALFSRRKSKFVVTAKRGRQTNSIWRFIAPQCLYLAGSGLAITWAVTRYTIGLTEDLNGIAVGSMLLLAHCWFAWEVIRRALRKKTDDDDAWRHPCALHVEYTPSATSRQMAGHAVTVDINEQGIGCYAFDDPGEIGDEFEITVFAMGEEARTKAKLIHKCVALDVKSRGRDGNANTWRCGFEFVEPSSEALAVVWRICADYATARLYDRFEANKGKLADKGLYSILDSIRDAEHRTNMPLILRCENDPKVSVRRTVTEYICSKHCGVVLTHAPEIGQEFELEMATPFGPIRGQARVAEVRPVRLGVTDLVFARLEFGRFLGECRSLLLSLCNAHGEQGVSTVLRLRPPEKALPYIRPTALAAVMAVIAAVPAVAWICTWHQEALLLTRAARVEVLEGDLRGAIYEMVAEAERDDHLDETRVMKLRSVLQEHDDLEGVGRLDELILRHEIDSFPLMLTKAHILEERKRFDDAWEYYQSVLADSGSFADEKQHRAIYTAVARNAANRGDFATASEQYAQIGVEYLVWESSVRREYAGVLFHLERWDEAASLFQRGAPMTLDDHLLLGGILSSGQHFDQAIVQFQQALRLEPKSRLTRHYLVDSAMALQDYKLALSSLNILLAEDADDRDARRKQALCFLWSGNADRGLQLLEPLYVLDPSDAVVRLGLLEACAKVEGLSDTQIRRLVNLADQILDTTQSDGSPSDAEMEQLVYALANAGKYEKRILLLERLVQRLPGRYDLRVRLVENYEELEEFEKARPIYRSLVGQLDQADSIVEARQIQLAAARNAARLGEISTAVKWFSDATNDALPADEELREEYVGLLWQLERFDEALEVYARVESKSLNDYLQIGGIYGAVKQYELAVETYETVLDNWPGTLEALQGLTVAAIALSEFELAEKYNSLLLDAEPTNEKASRQQALLAVWMGDAFEGLQLVRQQLDNAPTDTDLQLAFVQCCVALDRISSADVTCLKAIAQSVQVSLESGVPEADSQRQALLQMTAYALNSAGELALAGELFSEYLNLCPEDNSVRLTLAQSLDQLQEFDQAWVNYELLLKHQASLATNRGHVSAEAQAAKIEKQLFVGAARNAANRGDWVTSANLFARLGEEFLQSDFSLRREYAGVLVRAGLAERALHIFPVSADLTWQDQLSLAGIHIALEQYELAGQVCQRVLAAHPGNREALRCMADCALALEDFDTATKILTDLAQGDTRDLVVSRQLALALLWSGHEREASLMLDGLLDDYPDDLDLQIAFIHAFLQQSTPAPERAPRLVFIANRYLRGEISRSDYGLASGRWDYDTDIELLVYGLNKIDKADEFTPLLESLVSRKNDRLDLKLRLAEVLDRRGRYAEAWPLYEVLLESGDEDANVSRDELLLAAARNAANRKEWQLAAEQFSELSTKTVGTDTQIRREYAGVLAELGHFDEALQLFEGESEFEFDDHLLLGGLAAAGQDYEMAVWRYQQALANDPTNRQAILALADCAIAIEDYPLASQQLRKLLDLNPADTEIERKLALVLVWSGQSNEALARLEEQLAIQPDDSELQQAFIQALLGIDTHTARQIQRLESINQNMSAENTAFLQALPRNAKAIPQHSVESTDSTHGAQFELLAYALIKVGKWEAALPWLQSLTTRDPSRADLQMRLVETLTSLERNAEAWPLIERLLDSHAFASEPEEYARLQIVAARNAANRKQFDQAADLFRRIDRMLLNADAGLRNEYAGVLATLGEYESAIALYPTNQPRSYDEHVQLGGIYSMAKRFRDATREYNAALEIRPDNAQVLHYLVDNAIGMEDYRLAYSGLRRLLQIDPNNLETQAQLAITYLRSDQPSDAMGILEPLLRSHLAEPSLQRAFIEACMRVSALTQQQVQILRLLAGQVKQDNQLSDRESVMLALVLSKAGITDNLLPVLKQLVLDNPQRVDLRLQLIDVLQQEQRFEEAEHHLQWLVNSETAKKPERFTSHLDVASPEGSPRIELIERESAARQSLPFLDAAYGHLPSLPRPATPVGGQ